MIEAIIVVSVISLMAGMFLPPMLKKPKFIHHTNCINDLKQISLGLLIWSSDNGDHFPWSVRVKDGGGMKDDGSGPLDIVSQFLITSNLINTPTFLVCPMDSDKKYIPNWDAFAKQDATHPNISYFYNQDADEKAPQTILVGDRSLLPAPGAPIPKGTAGAVTLSLNRSNFNTLDWDQSKMHKGTGNIAFADGSVQQFSRANLRQQVGTYVEGTTNQMRLIYPGY